MGDQRTEFSTSFHRRAQRSRSRQTKKVRDRLKQMQVSSGGHRSAQKSQAFKLNQRLWKHFQIRKKLCSEKGERGENPYFVTSGKRESIFTYFLSHVSLGVGVNNHLKATTRNSCPIGNNPSVQLWVLMPSRGWAHPLRSEGEHSIAWARSATALQEAQPRSRAVGTERSSYRNQLKTQSHILPNRS